MSPIIVNIVIEGNSDEPVARRLLEGAGFNTGNVYIQRGKDRLDEKLKAYNNAARHTHWFVIRDMDRDAECPSALVQEKLPAPAPLMSLRIAVRSIEAWLLADRERISNFLSVSIDRIPLDPESIMHPKTALVEIAKHSRRREIRDEMVPAPNSITRVGIGYTSRIIEFASTTWRPKTAARHSRSLARCMEALERWK